MEEQIKFYEQIVDSQLLLRSRLKNDQLTTPAIDYTLPRLLDIVDEQISLLNKIIFDLKQASK